MTRKKFISVQDMNLKIQVICIIRAREIFLYRQPAQKKSLQKDMQTKFSINALQHEKQYP